MTTAIMVMVLSIYVNAIPIPTTVYGTITGSDDAQIFIDVENATHTLPSQSTVAENGLYGLVIATNGIKLINIDVRVEDNGKTVYENRYKDVETGSKLEINVTIQKEIPPIVEAVAKDTGGGGGTNEPRVKDMLKYVLPNQEPDEPPIDEKPDDLDEPQPTPESDVPLLDKPDMPLEENAVYSLNLILIVLIIMTVVIMLIIVKRKIKNV